MAAEQLPLTVIFSPAAIDELDRIWRWNAERHGITHADAYLRFLKDNIDHLATDYLRGRSIPGRTDLYYIIIRRRAKGHGHIAVYSYDVNEVYVLHVFHTARDWQKMAD